MAAPGVLYLLAAAVLALRVRGVRSGKLALHPKASVLLPVRDEAENIEAALGCLSRQTYPLDQIEVLVIDDGSRDDTADRARRAGKGPPRVRVLKVPPLEPGITGKQGALDYGLRRATGSVILTTDADVRVSPTWVAEHVSRLPPHGERLICGLALPASTKTGLGRLLSWFEAGELLLLQTVAAGWTGLGRPLSGFGKNLSYERKVMEDLGGYRALGFAPNEDMRLVQRAGRRVVGWAGGRAATVLVLPSSGLGTLLRRRARWARHGYRTDPWLFGSTLVAFLSALGTLGAIGSVIALGNGWLGVLGAGPLALGNLLLLARGAAFAGRPRLVWSWLLVLVGYPFYVMALGLWTVLGPRETAWRGRPMEAPPPPSKPRSRRYGRRRRGQSAQHQRRGASRPQGEKR
jgi:glycosyltransferase involved in cell wall biosynthesis